MGRELEGIRIIDLGQIYAAPYCTLQLAAMGAEVIKVEPPGRGEGLRHLYKPPSETNYAFLMLNADKKSITLNLKDPRGREILMRMLDRADVLVENFLAGVMEALELDYERLRGRFPRLIYASAKGYASGSRWERLGAMDACIQAACGFVTTTGFPDRPGVKTPATFIDMGTGSHLATAIMAALFARERTGRGRKVEVAMLDVALPAMTTAVAAALEGHPMHRLGNRHLGACPCNFYPARDGELLIFCLTLEHWRRLLRVIGRSELVDEPRFTTNRDRMKHADEIDAMVGAWTSVHDRGEMVATMLEAGVPCAPVRGIEEIVADPELYERRMLRRTEYSSHGAITVFGTPLQMNENDSEREPVRKPPQLGEHTGEVLGALGIGPAEREALRQEGVI